MLGAVRRSGSRYLGIALRTAQELFGATTSLGSRPESAAPSPHDALTRLDPSLAMEESEIERLREQLLAAESRLRPFLESSLIGVIVGNLHGTVTEANDAFLWMVGYTRQELAARQLNWIDLTPPEHRHLDARALGRLQRRRSQPPYEKEYLRKDGSRIPVIVIGIGLLGDSADQFIAFALPLIERQSSQEALRVSESRLSGIIASVAEAIVTIDEGRRIVVFNPAAERLFRCSAAEAIGQPLDRFIPERFHRAHAEHIRFSSGTESTGPSVGTLGTLVWQRSDGEEFSIEVSISHVEVTGQTLHTIVLRDVTERERAEAERARLLTREQQARAEAEAANRTKDEFLATVSHELRTPLSAMITWARLLRAGRLDAATTARALETIERNTKVLAQLIDDLLDVSRIISGKLRLEVDTVELASVVAAALEAVRPAAEAKTLVVDCALDPMVGPVAGDPGRLQQVVWNLLANAIKFTPRGGRVRVALDGDGSLARIVVSDTGKGVSPDFLPYIFDRFRQADSTTTRRHGGLGLGLAIVRHLVELHGGTVGVESAGDGCGATFTVCLPIAAVRHGDHGRPRFPAEQAPERLPVLEGLCVLVVDDQADARESVTAVLEERGAHVVVVASAAEALEAIERYRPQVLVSDIGMPGEDGYELIRKVRALRPEEGGRIPAAALTAYARIEDRAQALQAGYQIHVPKPVDPAALIAVVARLAEATRAA